MSAKLFREKDAIKVQKLHPDLQRLIYKTAEIGGKFIIIWTERGKIEQNKAFKNGFSNAKFGQSAHNYVPALGFDFGPSNYPGHDRDYADLWAIFYKAASELGIAVTWGGRWKRKDLGHIELTNWKNIKSKKLAA